MIKLPIKEKGGVVMRKQIVEQDDNTPKVIYHAIKFGDKYLARLGSELTSDLGQARLYKNLETWYKNNESILKKLGKANYKIVGVTLKESKEQMKTIKLNKKETELLRKMFDNFVSNDNKNNQGYEMATLRSVNEFIEANEIEHNIPVKSRCHWCLQALPQIGSSKRFMGKWYHAECYIEMKDHYGD